MMKEMESHSKKTQLPKHRYSQQSVAKQRESEVPSPQQGDTFSAAVDALSKLQITSHDESTKEETKLTDKDGRKELSPSVAAVFNAVSSGDVIQSPKTKSSPPARQQQLKSESQPQSSSPSRMPEAIQKLMTPPTSSSRGPLLPHPPPYHHPQIPIRGRGTVSK